MALALLLSLGQRQDLRLFTPVNGKTLHTTYSILDSLKYVVLMDREPPYASRLAHLLGGIFLVLALTGWLGRRNIAVALWSLATIALAMGSGGVTYFGYQGTYRFLAVVPVLVLALAKVLVDGLPDRRPTRIMLTGSAAVLLTWSIFHAANRLSTYYTVSPQLRLFKELRAKLPADFWKERSILILRCPEDPLGTCTYFSSIAGYLAPQVSVEIGESHCRLPHAQNRQEIRVSTAGYHCSISGPSLPLGHFDLAGTQYTIEQIVEGPNS
jgi:hypothetical protein